MINGTVKYEILVHINKIIKYEILLHISENSSILNIVVKMKIIKCKIFYD